MLVAKANNPDPMFQPPQDLDAEEQLLAVVFIREGKDLDSIIKILEPEDFYQTSHKIIYGAFLTLKSKGHDVTLATVASHLKETGKFKQAGGEKQLLKIADNAPMSLNPKGHAQIIKDCSVKRKILNFGQQLVNKAGRGKPVEALFSFIEEQSKNLNFSQKNDSPFQLIPFSNLETKEVAWLVKSLLERNTLSQWFGDPGCGKTFMGIDLGCCIATGLDFHGLNVTQGPVIYIAGEGHNGLQRRFQAWQIRHQVSLDNAPIYISTTPASFCDPASIPIVQAAIEGIGKKPAVIFIDTLARNFGPGDENSTQEMTSFIASLDAIRTTHKCAIVLIHHTGHGDKSRGRGAMALKGALDAEYRLEKDDKGVIRMTNTKMKDFEPPAPMAFKIRSVDLGIQDEDGQEITGGILDGVEYLDPVKKKSQNKGKWQVICHGILMDFFEKQRRNLENSNFDPNQAKVLIQDVKTEALVQGLPSKHWNRYFNYLSGLDGIRVNHPYFETIPQSSPNHPNGEK